MMLLFCVVQNITLLLIITSHCDTIDVINVNNNRVIHVITFSRAFTPLRLSLPRGFIILSSVFPEIYEEIYQGWG